MQQGQSHIQAECGELRIIPVALVAHKGVRSVYLQPLEIRPYLVQTLEQAASFQAKREAYRCFHHSAV